MIRILLRRNRDTVTLALIAGAVVVWLAATYFFFLGRRGIFAGDDAEAPASASPAPAPSASGAPTSASKPYASGGVLVEDVSACVVGLFPDKSFRDPPRFEFVCTEADPVKGSAGVKSALVKGAAGNTTMAMRDWVTLGWYEMIAYSLLRAQCCSAPPPLAWSFEIACPVDKPLKRFEKLVRARDPSNLDKVMFDYAEEIRCLSRFGQAPNFNQGAPPGRGMESMVKFLDRAGLKKPG